jgi:hypothetical protein
VVDLDIFEAPRRLALSPDGAHAYLTLLASTLVYARTPGTGRGTLTVKGKGPLLGLPTQPLGLPVRVQFQSRGGVCWEATFSAAGTKRNDAVTYTGNAD